MAPFASSNATLPASLHAIYQKYKAGTWAVIDWLVSHSASTHSHSSQSADGTIPVRKIVDLAVSIAGRRIKPPKDIQNVFKLVLISRKHLTSYYDGLPDQNELTAASTKRHTYFNETLAQAYDILFPKNAPKKGKKQRKPVHQKSQVPQPLAETLNRFESLSDLIEQEPDFEESVALPIQDDEHEAFETPSCDTCEPGIKAKKKPSRQGSAFEDDPLEDALNFHSFVLEMEAVANLADRVCEALAKEAMALALAGCILNMCSQHVLYLTALYKRSCANHEEFEDKYLAKDSLLTAQPHLETKFDSRAQKFDRVIESRYFSEGDGLLWPAAVLQAFKNRLDTEKGYSMDTRRLDQCFSTPQKEVHPEASLERLAINDDVSDVSKVSGDDCDESLALDSQEEVSFGYEMLGGIIYVAMRKDLITTAHMHDMVHGHSKNQHILLSRAQLVPLFLQALRYLVQKEVLGTELVCGLHMLVHSSKVFVYAKENHETKHTNLRLKALNLAKNVWNSIEEVRAIENHPIQRTHALNGRDKRLLDNVAELTQRFHTTDIPGLYHQTPWVVASEMSAILANAQGLGLVLLAQKGIWGQCLHMYNMVQKLGVCPKIDIMEKLCDLFVEEVFIGERPTRGFFSRRNLFIGGESFRAGGQLFVGPPNFNMRTEDKKIEALEILCKRIDPLKVSLLVDFVLHGTKASSKFWSQLAFGIKTKNADIDKSLEKLFKHHAGHEIINKAKTLLEQDFSGALPIARLNCFKAYKLGLDIIENFTVDICTGRGIPLELRDTQPLDVSLHLMCGIQFMSDTMFDIEMRMRNGHGKRDLVNHSALLMMRDAVMKACAGLTVQEFLWEEV